MKFLLAQFKRLTKNLWHEEQKLLAVLMGFSYCTMAIENRSIGHFQQHKVEATLPNMHFFNNG